MVALLRFWENYKLLFGFAAIMVATGWVEGAEELVLFDTPIWKVMVYAAIAVGFGLWFALPRQD